MQTMEYLKSTSKVVEYVLMVHPETRNSDSVLYHRVCAYINPLALQEPFGIVLLLQKDYKLPPFETVRRVRQKIQAAHPELAAVKDVKEKRGKLETEYKRFALAGE